MRKFYLSFLLPVYLLGQNLNELVDLSLQNELISSSKHSVESIKSQYSSIKNAYLPKVTVGANYSNTNEETASTPDSSMVGYANINYIIYDGGKKSATYNSYESNIKGANESLNSLKNTIAIEVVNYYYNYQSLVSNKEATLKEIEQLTAQYKRLKRFLDAGTTTSDEVDKIKSRVENANLTLHEVELQIQTVLHNLHYITSQQVTIEDGSLINYEDLDEQALRADIKVLEYDMKTKLSNARASKSSNYPMVSLDNTYNYYDMDYNNKAYDNGVESQNIFKVSFAWKLFDFGATADTYKSNLQQYKSVKSKYEYEKNKANIDLQLAIKSYDIAKLKISTAKEALKAATSTYETIEAKYQNGLVDNVAYLEALSEKYNAISSVKMAVYNLEIKKANIIYHSGKNVWEYIK